MGKLPKKTPEAVIRLIDTFSLHRESYLSGKYKETPVRREFIDPLFVALGWDIDNSQGYAEAYKDVVHEDAIKVSGKNKAPDYCFRVGGTRKFFLEAKKPSERFRDKSVHAYQLRRYGSSAKLPISILTDFENLAVYDCRIKPRETDGPGVAQLFIINYTEYIERWDEIASIFSREAILKGSFDKYAEASKDKKGTLEVDDAFLAEIESWRESLAKVLALRNAKLSAGDLNHAVQMIVDRIVFLRMCEDRGIEEYGALREIASGDGVYRRLVKLFERADDRYNSGLFHFHKEKGRSEPPDTLTTNLAIDDHPLKTILQIFSCSSVWTAGMVRGRSCLKRSGDDAAAAGSAAGLSLPEGNRSSAGQCKAGRRDLDSPSRSPCIRPSFAALLCGDRQSGARAPTVWRRVFRRASRSRHRVFRDLSNIRARRKRRRKHTASHCISQSAG